MNIRFGLLLLSVLLVAACQPAAPVQQVTKGDEIAYYDFSEAGTFEEATYADGAVRLQIRDGVYRVELLEGDSEVWYGQWGDTLGDVVIDVEARQFTEDQNTVYGVMCRVRGNIGQQVEADADLEAMAAETTGGTLIASADATAEATSEATSEATVEATAETTAEATSEATEQATAEATSEATIEATAETTPEAGSTADATLEAGGATILNPNNGDGYLFLIEGSGRFAIMRARGRSITPLVDWTSSSAINRGPAENRIRAVCQGDYLALYVNGEFLGDATDDTYTQGQVGLAAAAASRLGLLVEFDNLSVSEARTG